jgi:hypothetical protein
MIYKVYQVHPLLCPACGGKMRIISFSISFLKNARETVPRATVMYHKMFWQQRSLTDLYFIGHIPEYIAVPN